MTRARVTLKEGRTYSAGGKTFVLGRPLIIGDETMIAALKANSRFEVVDLESEGPAKQKATAPPPPAKSESKEEAPTASSGPITTSSLSKSPEKSKPAKSKPAKRSKAKSGKKKSTKKG